MARDASKPRASKFCNISPMRDDAAAFLEAEWLAPRPHSDTAIMLALAHTLVVEGLHDADFLARYCVGFERFRDYLLGARRRRRKVCGLGRAPERNSCRHDSRASRGKMARDAQLHHRQLVAAARRSRRAADLGGDRAGRDARPDRSARRRFRLRLRQHGGPRRPAAGCADAVAADGPQSGARLHPGRAHRRSAAQSGRSRSSTTARTSSIPISSSCTGAAAIRFIIIRISTG